MKISKIIMRGSCGKYSLGPGLFQGTASPFYYVSEHGDFIL